MAKDYSDIGLNSQLLATNSLIAQPSNFIDNYSLSQNYSFPSEALRYANINRFARQYTAVVTPQGEAGTFKDIQLAINYVNSIGGGSILITSGTYIPPNTINLYSNIHLYGEGAGKTIIELGDNIQINLEGTSGDLSLLLGYYSNALQNISIDNIEFDQNLTIENTTFYCLYFRYIRNLSITNCLFNGIGSYPCCAMQIITCMPTKIENNTGYNIVYGIDVSGGILFINNNGFVGTNTYDTFNIINLRGTGSINNMVVDGNYFENCSVGVNVKGATNCHILHNHFNGNNRDSDEIGGIATDKTGVGGTNARNITIDGNTIVNFGNGTGSFSIRVNYADYVNISNNIIDNNSTVYGIDVGITGACTNTNICSNTICGCGTGINIRANSDRALVVGNNVYGCTNKIVNSGSNTTSANNIIA
jgi:hypothetical protein